jgi:hypothetical protein
MNTNQRIAVVQREGKNSNRSNVQRFNASGFNILDHPAMSILISALVRQS